MMRFVFLVSLCFPIANGYAQNPVDVMRGRATRVDTLTNPVKTAPQFPGGSEALMDYVAYHINYPKSFRKKGFNTGPLLVKFLIQTDGRVGDVQVSSKTTPPELAEQMSDYVTQIRKIFIKMPRWEPAKLNGVPINYQYSLPFQVEIN